MMIRTPSAIAVCLATILASSSYAVASNTFTAADAGAFGQLSHAALALHRDVIDAMRTIGGSGDFNQARCLSDLQNSLFSMEDSAAAAGDLISISARMHDSRDEVIVNATLASNLSFALEKLSLDRRNALEQGAVCSTSPLVNTYAQKTAGLADRASAFFDSVYRRVAWLNQNH
jgi:hypothetical protein